MRVCGDPEMTAESTVLVAKVILGNGLSYAGTALLRGTAASLDDLERQRDGVRFADGCAKHLDPPTARACGLLLARAGQSGRRRAVAILAGDSDVVLTSDPDDLKRLLDVAGAAAEVRHALVEALSR
jgi:hypothetical protein